MSVTISTTGGMLILTYSDGRPIGIETSGLRTDMIGNDVFIYQTILENNKRIYSQNPDVIKLDYTQVTPSFGSAALLSAYLNDLIGALSGSGGAAGTSTIGSIVASANYT